MTEKKQKKQKKPNLFSRIKEMLSDEKKSPEDSGAEAIKAIAQETSDFTEDFSKQLKQKADVEALETLREEFNALVEILDKEEKPSNSKRKPATGEEFHQSQQNLANC